MQSARMATCICNAGSSDAVSDNVPRGGVFIRDFALTRHRSIHEVVARVPPQSPNSKPAQEQRCPGGDTGLSRLVISSQGQHAHMVRSLQQRTQPVSGKTSSFQIISQEEPPSILREFRERCMKSQCLQRLIQFSVHKRSYLGAWQPCRSVRKVAESPTRLYSSSVASVPLRPAPPGPGSPRSPCSGERTRTG